MKTLVPSASGSQWLLGVAVRRSAIFSRRSAGEAASWRALCDLGIWRAGESDLGILQGGIQETAPTSGGQTTC
jgi:hypothetical protein